MKFLREFFLSVQNSLVNPQYYLTVKDESFWATLRYLFSLLVFISLVYCLFFALTLIPLIPRAPQLASQIYPDKLVINIKNGILSTNVAQPYFYKDFLVIDTLASIDDYAKYQNKAQVLVTKTAVVYPNDVFYFRDLNQPVILNKAVLEPYLANLQNILILAIVFILITGPLFLGGLMLLEKLISLALFSLLAFVAIRVLKKKLAYFQVYKISSHASTLPILFFGLLGFLGLSPTVPFGYSLLLSLVIIVILHRVWTKIS